MKKEELFPQRVGYQHLTEKIMRDPNLSEERKKAFKEFEEIRDTLYTAYLHMVKENSRFSSSELESALREVTVREKNKNIEDNKKQWAEVIERYCADSKKNELKHRLIDSLDAF